MTDFSRLQYHDIDWSALRRNALTRKGWQKKSSADWDKKAKSFSKRTRDDSYVEKVLDCLPTKPDLTVLDVGSGPGTLAIPMAGRFASVTCIDYSEEMLKVLMDRARAEEITNITPVCCSWEDNWKEHGIQPHDIAIASRSVGVEDLQACLEKLNRFATRYVFLTDRIGPTPFEPEAFDALGRSFDPGPDYIYTLNILYTMGIHANVRIIELDREKSFPNENVALEGYRWMFHDLQPEEEARLRQFIQRHTVRKSRQSITVRRCSVPRWAMIWWSTLNTD